MVFPPAKCGAAVNLSGKSAERNVQRMEGRAQTSGERRADKGQCRADNRAEQRGQRAENRENKMRVYQSCAVCSSPPVDTVKHWTLVIDMLGTPLSLIIAGSAALLLWVCSFGASCTREISRCEAWQW